MVWLVVQALQESLRHSLALFTNVCRLWRKTSRSRPNANQNRMHNDPTAAECLARVSEVIRALSFPASRNGSPVSDALAEEDFDELARSLFAHQFQRNPVLRRLCESRGVSPATVANWRDLPAMPASAFKEFEVTTLPASERTAVFHSSGTTGQKPSRHFHSAASLALYEASLLSWFGLHLLGKAADLSPANPTGLSLICLTPPPALAPHSSLVHMLETVRRGFAWERTIFLGGVEPDATWSLDLPKLLSFLDQSVRAGIPAALLGTTFNFVQVLDYLSAGRREFRLPPASRVMETGGYKGRSRALSKADLHDRLTRFLGIPARGIVSEYGMSELGSQAYDISVQPFASGTPAPERLFRFPPWARVCVISPETGREVGEGETGLIRVCDLANVCSVIALQTEDLGVRRQGGFELLGRAAESEPRGCSLMSA